MKIKKKQVVFVGLSGGVDSAVSAALLKERGFDVVGVFIKTWHPDFLECNEEEERHDAMRVAAHLDIPFLTFDLSKEYKKSVGDYMIREYRAGRTPNPDVMCNKEVKFGAFLKKALAMGADYVATGHYAQNKNFSLAKGVDPTKDQSYFLWTLTQKQLPKIIFPVGNLKKRGVRALAKKFKLPVAEKKDSQGICFLGAVDLKEFLKHYIKTKKGKVLDVEGKVIGHHDGVVFHTLGERHGFTITKKGTQDSRYYIVGKDLKKNVLYVSQNPLLVEEGVGGGDSKKNHLALKGTPPFEGGEVNIKHLNWISGTPKENKKYTAQIRYHGELLPCKIKCQTSGVGQVVVDKSVLVASGQSIVLYDRDVCLGGGIVV